MSSPWIKPWFKTKLEIMKLNDFHELDRSGGEAGIRTLDRAFQPYNGLANRRLQPLGHLSIKAITTWNNVINPSFNIESTKI